MLDFLKQKSEEQPMDVKTIRQRLLNFIKDQLQRWEGGEGGYIKGLQFFLAPSEEERHFYEAAVFQDEEHRFKEDVQKIADDYAIDLPHGWNFETIFIDELPAEAIKASGLPVALHITTNKQPTIGKLTTAYIKVLSGEAEQPHYTITSTSGKICIGRDHQTQTTEGFFRENEIAFPSNSNSQSNKSISRQHAHIEWNPEAGCFFLFADTGGLPPNNKVKVQTANGSLIRLQAIQIGHPLQEGDQIILGESAVLEFSYQNSE